MVDNTSGREPRLGGEGRLTGMEPGLGGTHLEETLFFSALRRSNRFVYYFTARIMGTRGHGGAMTSLRAALQSGSEVERGYAATALGWIADDATVPDLIRALTDHKRYVREVAVWALIKIGDPALPTLHRALEHVSPRVRAQVALVLGEIGSDAAIDALLAAGDDSDILVREASNRGLAMVGFRHQDEAARVIPTLGERLQTETNAAVRAQIAAALGAIGNRAASTYLLAAMADRSAEVRAIAAKSLGQMSEVRAVPVLIAYLTDRAPCGKNDRVCDVAAEALACIGTRDARQALDGWRGVH